MVDESWAKGVIVLDNGKRVGQSGLFPLNYVLNLPPLPMQTNGSGNSEGPCTATVVADMNRKLDNEIDLRKGEQVRVLKLGSDWCEVKTEDGRTGTCPRPFLRIIEPATSHSLSVHMPTELEKTFSVPSPRGEQAAETRPYCRALYQFRGEYNGELNFDAGELIYLRRKVDDDWLEGESQKTGSVGMFPRSFVEIVVDLLPEGVSATPSASANKRTSHNEPETIGLASVLYDFQARYPDELSVKAGYSVKVLEVTNDEWVRCWNPVTDEEGIVPQGFLQIFLDDDADEDPTNADQDVPCPPAYYEPPPAEDDVPSMMGFQNQQETSHNSWNVPEPERAPCAPELNDVAWRQPEAS
ncbi:Protein Y37A1B.17 a, partial [Aphelenchoides avenae]